MIIAPVAAGAIHYKCRWYNKRTYLLYRTLVELQPAALINVLRGRHVQREEAIQAEGASAPWDET